MKYKHIFGPVPSRRLGISLGVDVVNKKVCNLNCVYCECGTTTILTNERKEYVPADEVIQEVADYIKSGKYLDYITFSGWGEPTLNSKLGYIIEEIKKVTNVKICVITNGILLYEKKVREDLKKADLVMPNLDYVLESSLKKIGRPAEKIDLKKVIIGLKEFRKEYSGLIYLEIFVIEGENDSLEELNIMKEIIKEVKPDKVQLNSLDRPSTEKWVKKASFERLETIKNILDYPYTEIITKYVSRQTIKKYDKSIEDNIINMLKKRPCTIEDLKNVTGIDIYEINKYLDILEKENKIKTEPGDRGIFLKYIE